MQIQNGNFVLLRVLASLLGMSSALSQEIAADPEEIFITSSRVPLPLRQLGASVSVLTREEIEDHGNISLTAILRQLTAISSSSNGGAGQPTSLRIRGEEGFRTLTIFDGIRLSDPSGTQVGPQLEHLVSSGIGRVEVLRGPQGLGYGADAGGVLNISSLRSGKGLSASFDAQAGRFATRQYSANAGGGNESVDFFISAADYETEGFNTRDTDTILRDRDGYENTTLHGRVGFNINDKVRADVVFRDVDGKSMYDGCGSFDCVSLFDMQAARFGLEYSDDDFSHSINFAKTQTGRNFLNTGVSTFAAIGELVRFEYLGSARNLQGFDLVFGFDMEEASSNGKGRDNVGYFAEYLSDFSDSVYLTAGVRYDDNDDFGTNTSYRVSAAYLYELANGNTVKFKSSYGTGFRAPSPSEIAYNAGPNAFPPAANVILQKETSKGHEFGIEYLADGTLHLEAAWFDQDVDDAIEFDLANFSGYTQLIGTSNSRGIELNGRYTIGTFDMRANFTWNDTERPNGLHRSRRPGQLANLGLTWNGLNNRLALNAFYRISRDSHDGASAPLTRLDDFEILDLSASFDLFDSLQIYGRVENALDEDYEEIANYNTPGSAAYVGFKLNFQSL